MPVMFDKKTKGQFLYTFLGLSQSSETGCHIVEVGS